MNEKADNQVRILPVETRNDVKDKSGKKQTITRHWLADKKGRFFQTNLSAALLKPALIKNKVKIDNVELSEQGDCIVYRYTGRPLIILNSKNGQFYTLPSELEEHNKEAIQQQAHILLNVLKQNQLSNATQTHATTQTNARKTLNKLKTYKQP